MWSTRSGAASRPGARPVRVTVRSKAAFARIRPALPRAARGALQAVGSRRTRGRPAATRPARCARRARPPARSRGRARRGSPRVAQPVSSAVGCISQAAPAITTASSPASARPPANAWRNAASENATTRPIDRAYVAACIASSLSNGNGSGQRSGCSPAVRGARGDVARGRPPARAAPGSSSRASTGTHGRRDRHDLQDALGGEVRLRAAEVEVEDRRGRLVRRARGR